MYAQRLRISANIPVKVNCVSCKIHVTISVSIESMWVEYPVYSISKRIVTNAIYYDYRHYIHRKHTQIERGFYYAECASNRGSLELFSGL